MVNLQSQLPETIKTPTGGAGNGKPARPVENILSKSCSTLNTATTPDRTFHAHGAPRAPPRRPILGRSKVPHGWGRKGHEGQMSDRRGTSRGYQRPMRTATYARASVRRRTDHPCRDLHHPADQSNPTAKRPTATRPAAHGTPSDTPHLPRRAMCRPRSCEGVEWRFCASETYAGLDR